LVGKDEILAALPTVAVALSRLLTIYLTKVYKLIACVAADSFPFSGGAETKQASEKRASKGARLG